MSREHRQKMVWAMTKTHADGTLAAGKRFTFPVSGDTYEVKPNGSVRSTKVHLSKSQQKQAKKMRRLDREAVQSGDNRV